jgi:DNA-binding NarL/FixJ family response regulator
MLESARRFGSWDAVVCAMRACPGLATQLVESDEGRLAVAALCRRSGDAVLARHVGLSESRHSSSELLSTREMQVLGFVSQGATNKEIASALFIASSTVKAHLDNAFRKLGARNRAEAAVRYAEIAAARGGRS